MVCRTVTDLGTSSNLLGFCIALLSVLSSTMQQVFCRTMQQRNGLGFLEFLSHTATAQAIPLLPSPPTSREGVQLGCLIPHAAL